jgi:hypothetical protein
MKREEERSLSQSLRDSTRTRETTHRKKHNNEKERRSEAGFFLLTPLFKNDKSPHNNLCSTFLTFCVAFLSASLISPFT